VRVARESCACAGELRVCGELRGRAARESCAGELRGREEEKEEGAPSNFCKENDSVN